MAVAAVDGARAWAPAKSLMARFLRRLWRPSLGGLASWAGDSEKGGAGVAEAAGDSPGSWLGPEGAREESVGVCRRGERCRSGGRERGAAP